MKCYAHYANELRSQVMIALRQLKGPHTGENQAELILSIIKEFNLQDKIGYFVTDNAKNNDTAIDTIFRTLRPEWSEEQRKARRLRCLGHVINLAAQAFLYGKDIDAFEINMLAVRECSDLKKELELWRQRGPVGKLHNVITFICRIPQRREAFSKLRSLGPGEAENINHLNLVSDNATRWTSLFSMIDRAIQL